MLTIKGLTSDLKTHKSKMMAWIKALHAKRMQKEMEPANVYRPNRLYYKIVMRQFV